MSKPLLPLTIEAPGFFGLNTQQAGSILPPGWATKLENFVFDDSGRISSRMGSRQQNATVITSSPTVKAVHEYIDASGNSVNILACDNKIYKEVAGTMTDVTNVGMTTPTDDHWQFANFNGWCVGYQAGHTPIVSTSATSPDFDDIPGVSGTNFFKGSMVIAAYGRTWTVLDNTLYYSDLLINDFSTGSAGNFDLAKYWPDGMDEAVALADFNGYLVVFGKESIIVYENADDVTVMSIVEGISSIGCLYRDSVQVVGKDIVFMSSTGLRTLGRSLQDGAMPLGDVSQHVRDKLLLDLSGETAIEVKSVYNEKDGFYLISLPTAGKSYYFDTARPLEDGAWKATTWTIAPTAMHYTQSLKLEMAVEDGYLSEYTGYRDGDDSSGTGGALYTIDFEGVWNDFATVVPEAAPLLKIPKNVSVLGSGTSGNTVSFKWALDYSSTFNTIGLVFNTVPGAVYGVAIYGIDTYASQGIFERIKAPLSSAGQVMKIGLITDINGSSFSVQRIDVLAKTGRIGL